MTPAGLTGESLSTARSGRWHEPSTWASGQVPEAWDEVVIATGHAVEFDQSAAPQPACARLEIAPGAAVTLAPQVRSFVVGGAGRGRAGGVHVHGSLGIGPGQALEILPDGNDVSEEDGATVHAGGLLEMDGDLLHEGTVLTAEHDADIGVLTIVDDTLPGQEMPDGARLVWRSGDLKGRWFELIGRDASHLLIDSKSRMNEGLLGPPDHVQGLAQVSGRVVTGQDTAWTAGVADGSWWWCEADGIEDRRRVRRMLGPADLELDAPYQGAGCVEPAAYVLRDENQPFDAIPFQEQVRPGDRYTLFLPATLRSRDGSDLSLEQQIFVRIEPGAGYSFYLAAFESVGNEAWEPAGGSGVRMRGVDGSGTIPARFDTVEIFRFAGDAGLEWVDSTRFDVDWAFIHWTHPLVQRPNEGHGLKFKHTTPAFSFDDVRVRNARFDRLNDDFIWWSTRSGGESGVYDSIGAYCPNTDSGHSCDAVDTASELVGASGGQLRLERNFFRNIGTDHGASCLLAAVNAASGPPAWIGQGWVARDNVCLNIQSGPCLTVAGEARAWDQERIWAVNNVCAAVHGNGVQRIPFLYQNEILDFGLRRVSGATGIRGVYQAHGNIVRGAAREMDDDFSSATASVGTSLAGEAHWSGTAWRVMDNVFVQSVTGLRVKSWSSSMYPTDSTGQILHNLFVMHPANTSTQPAVALVDIHTEPAGERILVRANVMESLGRVEFRAGTGADGAAMDRIEDNIVNVIYSPAWSGALVSSGDLRLSTGIDPGAGVFTILPGSEAWDVLTPDRHRLGPRFAGVIRARLPVQAPWMIPAVVQTRGGRDSDGDGLVDIWDNCPATPNLGWADTDGDGVGDACQPCRGARGRRIGVGRRTGESGCDEKLEFRR